MSESETCPVCGKEVEADPATGDATVTAEGIAHEECAAHDEIDVLPDGGQEMTEWECGNCGDSFETPGEPELPCLVCGADEWQEVDAE